jgi:lycopene beta-cyclase
MDFRVSQTDGPHFFYVLPLAADQALVENTYLFPCEVGLERHRAEIAGYMRQRYGIDPDGFDVLDEERGAIPMTARHHPARVGRRVYPIGLAGGAARPSSGYAFLRTQRQTRHLARQLMTGRADKDPGGISGPKHRRLDEVFLRVLKARPRKAPVIFRQLFARADADSLVRFLGARSTPLDDVRVLAALPKRPFFETK